MKTEISTALDSISTDLSTFISEEKAARVALQRQIDAIDLQTKQRGAQFTLSQGLKEVLEANPSVTQLLQNRSGRAVFSIGGKHLAELMQRKQTTEIGAGFMTTGVMPIDRIPGIVSEARQVLTVRDALTANPTTQALVDFVRVSTPLTIASPVPEASTKPQNQLNFTSLSEKVRLLATWLPASRQIMDDMTELMSFIQTSLPYYVNLCEELQLLSGDGTGENLHGLIVQAAPFNASLLPSSGATTIDAIACAVEQIQVAKEISPTFAVLHPTDWWGMRLAKDTLGRYILGDPQGTARLKLFDLDVIATTSIAKGQFLVGSGSGAASEIRDRMEMQVEISTEHQDYFVKNLIAIRAEKRLALVVKRPNSYVQGTFGSLPAASGYGSSSSPISSPSPR